MQPRRHRRFLSAAGVLAGLVLAVIWFAFGPLRARVPYRPAPQACECGPTIPMNEPATSSAPSRSPGEEPAPFVVRPPSTPNERILLTPPPPFSAVTTLQVADVVQLIRQHQEPQTVIREVRRRSAPPPDLSGILSVLNPLAAGYFAAPLTVQHSGTSTIPLLATDQLLLSSTVPASTAGALYQQSGSLFWDGVALAGPEIGLWSRQGDDVFRGLGNVGIGTDTPSSRLTVIGTVLADALTAASATAASDFAGDLFVGGVLNLQQSGSGALVLGDTSGDSRGEQALDLQVFRTDPTQVASGLRSLAIGSANTVSAADTAAVGSGNVLTADHAVALGTGNRVSGSSSGVIGVGNEVAGSANAVIGSANRVNGSFNDVHGSANEMDGSHGNAYGYRNSTASGTAVTFAVGLNNRITANNAFVVGHDLLNDVPNSLMVGVSPGASLTLLDSGYLGLGTSTPFGPLVMSSGAHVTTGGVWTNASDRNLKENVVPVDAQDILQRIDRLTLRRWNYRNESPAVTHIGPFAQDFYAAFGVGGSDTSISTIDPAGIALVGVQALSQRISSIESLLASTTPAGSTAGWPVTLLRDFVAALAHGMARFVSVVTDTITVNDGIQLKDKTTGTMYCVQIDRGEWLKTKGPCGRVASADPAEPVAGAPQTDDQSGSAATSSAETPSVDGANDSRQPSPAPVTVATSSAETISTPATSTTDDVSP